MKQRDAFWGVAVLVVAVFGFVIGFYTDQAFPDVIPYVAHHSSGRVDTTELQQAIRLIQSQYVDANLDTTKLSRGTVQGLISALNDPFTAYYDADAYKRLNQAYTGHYSGIRIYQFSTTTTTELQAALKAGVAGSKGVVLDLREDPGGFISEADHVISEFVASGETFELRDRNGSVERHDVSGEH